VSHPQVIEAHRLCPHHRCQLRLEDGITAVLAATVGIRPDSVVFATNSTRRPRTPPTAAWATVGYLASARKPLRMAAYRDLPTQKPWSATSRHRRRSGLAPRLHLRAPRARPARCSPRATTHAPARTTRPIATAPQRLKDRSTGIDNCSAPALPFESPLTFTEVRQPGTATNARCGPRVRQRPQGIDVDAAPGGLSSSAAATSPRLTPIGHRSR
jgi:hypothetical protein